MSNPQQSITFQAPKGDACVQQGNHVTANAQGFCAVWRELCSHPCGWKGNGRRAEHVKTDASVVF